MHDSYLVVNKLAYYWSNKNKAVYMPALYIIIGKKLRRQRKGSKAKDI